MHHESPREIHHPAGSRVPGLNQGLLSGPQATHIIAVPPVFMYWVRPSGSGTNTTELAAAGLPSRGSPVDLGSARSSPAAPWTMADMVNNHRALLTKPDSLHASGGGVCNREQSRSRARARVCTRAGAGAGAGACVRVCGRVRVPRLVRVAASRTRDSRLGTARRPSRFG